MLLIHSTSPERLADLRTHLASLTSEPLVCVDCIHAMEKVLRTNPVTATMVDTPSPWVIRALARWNRHAPCYVVGLDATRSTEAVSVLPSARFLGASVDWHELAAALEGDLTPSRPCEAIVSVGAEDLLTLLGMTRGSARVEFRWNQSTGRLLVDEGVVVHAEREGRDGLDVALELLDWPSPTVTSQSIGSTPAASMHWPIEALIHESALRRDHRRRLVTAASTGLLLEDLLDGPRLAYAGLVESDTRAFLVERSCATGESLASCRAWVESLLELSPMTRRTVWDEDILALVVPLEFGVALSVVSTTPDAIGSVRRVTEAAAETLTASQAPPAIAGASTTVRGSLALTSC